MKTFNITFNEQQLQVLSSALIEMPFKMSEPIIRHINAEIKRQLDIPARDGGTGQVGLNDAD